MKMVLPLIVLRAYVYNAFSYITRLHFSVYRIRHSEVWLCLKNARKCPLSWEVRSGWLLLPPEKASSVRFTLFLFFYTLAHWKKRALVPELLNNEIVNLHISNPLTWQNFVATPQGGSELSITLSCKFGIRFRRWASKQKHFSNRKTCLNEFQPSHLI